MDEVDELVPSIPPRVIDLCSSSPPQASAAAPPKASHPFFQQTVSQPYFGPIKGKKRKGKKGQGPSASAAEMVTNFFVSI
jgi:hypothetical protein